MQNSYNTPLMKQYYDIKNQYPGIILFFRLGDFYEMFDEQAREVSAILGLTLTQRHGIPMCGIPFHAATSYIGRLLKAGKKIGICEQISTSADNKSKLFERKVIRVITPGTVMEDDMLRTLRISGEGSVTFPLVGNVQVAGYTVSEAEDRLAHALKTYLKNPQVSILIKEYGNQTVYVLGQVTKPAAIELPPEKSLTVLEAITSVGGFTDVAATSKVRVLRMENGVQKTLDVDVTQITKQGNKALDILLQPGDVVFVPQSMF